MTNYQTGTRFEHRVRDHLRERGYTVTRSAGSKSPVDLMAFSGAGEILVVQCKSSGTFPPAEWEKLLALKECEHTRIVLAFRASTGPAYLEITGPRVPGLGTARQPNCHEFYP